nr:hypothetical protein [Morganella morganii]
MAVFVFVFYGQPAFLTAFLPGISGRIFAGKINSHIFVHNITT